MKRFLNIIGRFSYLQALDSQLSQNKLSHIKATASLKIDDNKQHNKGLNFPTVRLLRSG